jgi:hypothetical protein
MIKLKHYAEALIIEDIGVQKTDLVLSVGRQFSASSRLCTSDVQKFRLS